MLGGTGNVSPMAKREYLEAIRDRYLRAKTRAEKSRLLDEICATTGYDRKYVTRQMAKRRPGRPARSKRGRKPIYQDPLLIKPLKAIWKVGNYPCSKRLKAMIPIWLPKYEAMYGRVDEAEREKMLSISAATIDRVMYRTRLQNNGRGKTTTKPGGLLRAQIPIQTGQWEETRPGFLEGDTVAHCGGSMAGEFAFTLDCVDIATGWSEQRAIWNKGAAQVVKQMIEIERALPFALLGFDGDNGSEFINEQLVKHFLSRQRPVQFTRSRAYRKNDNAHVEQKNWTHVRQWIGYDRFERPEVVELLNDLYANEWRLYHNFYGVSVKLLSKKRVGAKVIKRHDAPKTPYQRVMENDAVSDYKKRQLRTLFEGTNPFILRKLIDEKLRRIFQLCYSPPTNEGDPHDVG
jgi:hypothetical protein